MGERRDDNAGKAGAECKDIAGPMEEAPAYLETETTEEEEMEFIIESPVIEIFQEVVGETIAASEETEECTEFEEAHGEQMQVEVLEREVIVGSESMSGDGEVAANAVTPGD